MLLVMRANQKLPALTCQDAGRELYHQRYDVVQILGNAQTLQKIAWIFTKVSDMFDVQFQHASLIVRRVSSTKKSNKNSKPTETRIPQYSAYISEHAVR